MTTLEEIAASLSPSWSDVALVVANMRERDRREIFGLWDYEDEARLAMETCAADAWMLFRRDARPAAVCGAYRLRQGVYSAFAYGTDDWPWVVQDVTRWVRTRLGPWLRKAGAHRVECQSRADHTDAHAWLAYFGARRESILKAYGRDGSDYHQYVWTR